MTSTLDRLYRKAVWRGACLVWTGATTHAGHGVIKAKVEGLWRNELTHHVAWEEANGPLPNGLRLLHSCDTPPCLLIGHMFTGTQADNMKDMALKGRGSNQNKLKTLCKNGHPFDAENTYRRPGGERECRICRAAAERTRA